MSARGLLLVNLGSPSAPNLGAVKKYLHEFLTDKYVVDIPAALRYPLVYGIIVPARAQRSAAAYQKIWTSEGSPLTVYTKAFADGVRQELHDTWSVRWGMRYGEHNLREAVKNWQVDEIYIVPLYPQYAESSTRTAVEAAVQAIRQDRPSATIKYLQDFFAEREFIDAQSAQIASRIAEFKPDTVLLSFHGLPEHHMRKLHSDHCFSHDGCCTSVDGRNSRCYRAQAFATAAALRQRLPLAPEKIKLSFQSRLGRRPWIKPYTDHLVSELAASGSERLLVSCPSFVADCLETLEEVEIRLRDQFIGEGGDDLQLVPALNSQTTWVRGFAQMISRQDLNWQKWNTT
jgi:ferrochelatase